MYIPLHNMVETWKVNHVFFKVESNYHKLAKDLWPRAIGYKPTTIEWVPFDLDLIKILSRVKHNSTVQLQRLELQFVHFELDTPPFLWHENQTKTKGMQINLRNDILPSSNERPMLIVIVNKLPKLRTNQLVVGWSIAQMLRTKDIPSNTLTFDVTLSRHLQGQRHNTSHFRFHQPTLNDEATLSWSADPIPLPYCIGFSSNHRNCTTSSR